MELHAGKEEGAILADKENKDDHPSDNFQPKRVKYDDKVNGWSGSPASGSVPQRMISNLLKKPLKMCTPASADAEEAAAAPGGKENSIIRLGVGAMQLDSPATGFARSGRSASTPLQDITSPLNSRQGLGRNNRLLKRTSLFNVIGEGGGSGDGNGDAKNLAGGLRTELNFEYEESSQKQIRNISVPQLLLEKKANHAACSSRSQSESALKIMKAIERSSSDPLLIGDYSRQYTLPIVPDGKVTDLKEVSTNTLASVLKGEYVDKIRRYQLIDCRYPYEYEGGHIQSAINLFTQKQIYERYLQNKGPISPTAPAAAAAPTMDSGNCEGLVLIFHCEFSSKRGPDMCRFLRRIDRNLNMGSYPMIYYPEIYVLSGGYKAFYESHPELCTPACYRTMIDSAFTEELSMSKFQCKKELHGTGGGSISDTVAVASSSTESAAAPNRILLKKLSTKSFLRKLDM